MDVGRGVAAALTSGPDGAVRPRSLERLGHRRSPSEGVATGAGQARVLPARIMSSAHTRGAAACRLSWRRIPSGRIPCDG
jgi:hypothetical protein